MTNPWCYQGQATDPEDYKVFGCERSNIPSEPSNSFKVHSLQVQFLFGFQLPCHTTSPDCSHAEQVWFPKSEHTELYLPLA